MTEEYFMDHHAIEAAYVPFVSELVKGAFTVPSEGWSAELVAAHIACGNDEIAAAAELIAAGQHPSFDNGAAVDDAQLGVYADRAGGLSGLAAAIETSARRLAAAMEALDENADSQLLRARIVDAGMVVHDKPIPIRKLIEGNVTFHLNNHLEQLRALRR
jgi:hypothetical protein